MSHFQKKQVVVVIPVYKAELTIPEKLALSQCCKILASHPIIIIKPRSLSLDFLLNVFPSLGCRSFEDHFFKNIDGYNQLLISIPFYKSFSDYEYMLIYQLDAYVFKDDLLKWCSKGFDYIGAPGLEPEELFALQAPEKNLLARSLSTTNPVLNGGLSLRRISSLIRYLQLYQLFFPPWKGNEDKLFCLDARRLAVLRFFIRLPRWDTALQFSFEKSPAASYALTGQLPFGCHAWERYDPEFWKAYIEV